MSYGATERVLMEELTVEESMVLLRSARVGRIGFVRDGDVIVLPVNYVYDQGSVIFRTSRGAKFDAALRRARVAFEVDGAEHGAVWSVLVHGVAAEIWRRDELERVADLCLWSSLHHDHGAVVRISPAVITGRRIHHEPTAATLWLEATPARAR